MRRWTPAEDAVIRTGGACLRLWREVAAELGRTVDACVRRAGRLRQAARLGHTLPKARAKGWTPQEDAILLTARTYAEAAKVIGRSRIACRLRVRRLRRASQ